MPFSSFSTSDGRIGTIAVVVLTIIMGSLKSWLRQWVHDEDPYLCGLLSLAERSTAYGGVIQKG